jgi:hypothetical protein
LCNRKLRSKQHVTSVMSYTPICACVLHWDPRAPVHQTLVVVVISCRIITASSFARLFRGTKGQNQEQHPYTQVQSLVPHVC